MASDIDKWLRQQAQPVVQPQQSKATGTILPVLINVALVAVGVWMVLGRQATPEPAPGPAPIVNVAEATEAASKQYAANLAKVCNLMADEVDAGRIKSRADALEFAKSYALPARTNAFAPIDQMDIVYLPEGEWGDPPGIAFYFREKAKGHERAAK